MDALKDANGFKGANHLSGTGGILKLYDSTKGSTLRGLQKIRIIPVDAASLTLDKHSIRELRYSWPSHGLAKLCDPTRLQAADKPVVPTQEFLARCLLD
jgi:hypothetical protein